MFLSFIRVALTDAGEIPEWFGDDSNGSADKKPGKCVERKSDGSRRYCGKCQMFKPDRTHHCRICARCNLKMDHHCPWVNNCIGYRNYKFFILFISYSLASAIFVFVITLTLIPSVVTSDGGARNFVIVIDCIVAGALSVALLAFVSFHYYLLSQNYTTIEFLEKRGCCNPAESHENKFDLGIWDNLQRGLGSNPLLWPFPIDGGRVDQGEGTLFDANEAYP